MTAPRSRRQIAASTGVAIGVLRSLESNGLLPAGQLTAADEVVVRALTWADGARGGDRDRERALADAVRRVLAGPTPEATGLLVLVEGQVLSAHDELEALLVARGRRGAVTLLPLGAWVADTLASDGATLFGTGVVA